MRGLIAAVVIALTASACGGHPPIPKRGVVEGDLGDWHFRRFQELLDVEVWVDGNKAEAYSASYLTAAAEKRGRIEDKDLVNVIVTRYASPEGVVRATVKLARRLASEGGYQVEEAKIAGARTLTITGRGESWVMWPSSKHVVKVGGRGRADVPKAMVESYAERYPSLLPGGALEGALPPGPEDAPRAPPKQDYDPSSPRPDVDHYDPNKVKLPDRKEDAEAAPEAAEAAEADKPVDEPKPKAKPKKKKRK